MGACIRKRVVYDMSCKRFQFFVNVEALVFSRVCVSSHHTAGLICQVAVSIEACY